MNIQHTRMNRVPRKRRGFMSMELVLVLPILGIMVLGMIEFAMLFYARSSVVEACRVGARAATLQGADLQLVQQEISKVLSPDLQQDMQVNWTPGVRTGDTIMVSVSVPMTSASPDLLWPIGYSLSDKNLYSETRMLKE